MNKKGLSRVITTMILILMGIIVVGIFWNVVDKNLDEVSEKMILDPLTLDLEILRVQVLSDTDVEVTLKRNTGDGDLVGVAFVMYDWNSSEVIEQNVSLEELESKNFSVILQVVNASKIYKVSVAPIFKIRRNKEVLGTIQDEKPLRSLGGGGGGSSSSSSSTSTTTTNSIVLLPNEFIFGDGPHDLPTQVGPPPLLNSGTNEDIIIPHSRFPSFASPENKVYTQEGLFASLYDRATYKFGYYSFDGENWQAMELRGTNGDPSTWYYEGTDWIRGDAVFVYPEFFSEYEEVYVAIRGCHKAYTWLDEPWDCKGGWQLVVVSDNSTDAADPYERVHLDEVDPDCSDKLDYQCGSRTMCGETINYGSCQSEYDCNNNLCIAQDDLSCSGVTCESGEYCSRGICLLTVPGNTYFVALWGNDSNNGTYEEPFYSWNKAAEVSYPGDITYIRGGVWMPANRDEDVGFSLSGPEYYNTARRGEKDAWIRYFNYPGEKPILDKRNVGIGLTRWSGGIGMDYMQYIHLRGLTVRHVYQGKPDFYYIGKPYSELGGIGCSPCANIIYENLVAHNIDGRGFQHWSGAWNEVDGENPLYEVDHTEFINCDAYNLFDRYASEPGNAADGWKVGTYYNEGKNYVNWTNCRAWNYSDDGFDPHGSGIRIFENCWASSTGYFRGITPMWGTEGNGFKTTGPNGFTFSREEHNVFFKNCIAAQNPGSGFITNLVTPDEYPSNPLIVNTLSYKNGHAYWDMSGGDVRNNIAHGTTGIGPTGEIYNVVGDAYSNTSFYWESNNTWDLSSRLGWPPSHISSEYNVTDEDFVSLDVTQLFRPRKVDYSLPDITFGQLVEGSELIDGGIVVPGYHCSNSGEVGNCVTWYGSAPDLGALESNY